MTQLDFLEALLALPRLLTTVPENPGLAPGEELTRAVIAGFRLRGTTFNAWCTQNSITQQNANQAVRGSWNGPKAKELLASIVEASGAADQMKLQEAGAVGGHKEAAR